MERIIHPMHNKLRIPKERRTLDGVLTLALDRSLLTWLSIGPFFEQEKKILI